MRQYFQNERREIAPLLPERMERVLEIGCGAGTTMRWIRAEHGVRYAAGIELFADAARQAASVFDTMIEGDVEAGLAQLGEESFDMALALDVLEHLLRPEQVVAQLHARLVPGGRLVVSLPHVGHFRASLPLAFQGRWEYGDEGLLDRTHLRFFSERSARALLEEAGFEIERMGYVRSYPNLLRPFGVEDRRGRWYTSRVLDRTPLRHSHLFKFQFLIAGRRRA